MASSSRQGREKRSKSSHDRIDSVHVSWFNRKQLGIFNEACKDRKVIIERLFDRNLLVEMKFKFLKNLEDWGMWKLINCEHGVWPNAVRAFYFFGKSFKYDQVGGEFDGGSSNDNIKTTVFGTEFEVDKDLINRQLGFREAGETGIPNNFNYIEACRVVYGDNKIDKWVDDVTKLDAHTRILHLMVC